MRKPQTAVAIARLKKPGRYAVGDGVALQISKWHTRAWVFRYERLGRAHYMGLGPYPLVSLAAARAKGRELRLQLLDGIDPLALRKQKRTEELLALARDRTFEQCAHDYIASHEAGWSPASSAQWRQSLAAYVFPTIGKLPAAEIDLPLVLRVLEPIWQTVPETASRVRGRIEAILGWATVRGLRSGDNPARWSNHLEHVLPNRRSFDRVERFAALPYKDIGTFMQRLCSQPGMPARALELGILTAARRNEVLGARWDEIQDGVWTVPAERMKGKREQRVPLSRHALTLLAALPRESEYVFAGAQMGKPIHLMSIRDVLVKMGSKTTMHGFRSTFRDWAAEQTNYPNHVVEQALAHSISSAVEAAYRRGDLFEKRRRLMQDWADYCERGHVDGDVVPLRQGMSA
jgi:integrase